MDVAIDNRTRNNKDFKKMNAKLEENANERETYCSGRRHLFTIRNQRF